MKTDCRSDVGIAVGLIDTIINCARILGKMNRDDNLFNSKEVDEAVMDFINDEDVQLLITQGVFEKQNR